MITPRFGWCGPLHHAPLMQQAGLDYIEGQLVPLHIEDDAAKAGGYTGLLSSECAIKGDPVIGMRESTAFLRRAWAAA